MSYCVGLEISGENYYLKADSARVFNDWIRVRRILLHVSLAFSQSYAYPHNLANCEKLKLYMYIYLHTYTCIGTKLSYS